MSHILVSEPDGTGAVITFTGVIKPDEIFKLKEEIGSHPDFSRWRYQIWDYSQAETLEFTMDDLRQFATAEREIAQINPSQRIALIPRPFSHQGLDSMFQIYEGVWGVWQTKTFRDIDSARKWANAGQ